MTKPRRKKPVHPLKRLSDQQKRGELNRLISTTEAQIATAFADARASVQGVLRDFAQAYAAERKRIADEEDVEVESVKVPLHWLQTSGWGVRVRHALTTAHLSASHASRRYVQQAIRAAVTLGERDARALLMVAMRPAIRAGMTHWRPK